MIIPTLPRWAYIGIIAVVILITLVVYTTGPFSNRFNRSLPSAHMALAHTSIGEHKTYLEAPVSMHYYAPKQNVQVKASGLTYTPTVLPINSFSLPLIEILKAIIKCESNNNPLARNPSSSAKGLFQILDGTWNYFQCEGDVLVAEDNYQCGVKIATQSGLHHWNASRACWSKYVE